MILYLKRTCTWLLMVLLALNVAAVPAFAKADSGTTNPLQASVEKYLADLQKDENSIGLQAGISIYDLTDQTTLYQHNQGRTFIPASNMKLFTTVAALDRLGPDYQWKTEVYTTGQLTPEGVLNGDLILKGFGDPSLSAEDLQAMAAELKQKGIRQINGNLLLDESYFDDTRLGVSWMWDDEVYGYSAQISALAVHKNNITMTVIPGKNTSSPPSVSLEPATSYVKLTNQIKTVEGTTNDITLERPRGKNEIILTGNVGTTAKPYVEDVTMEDPALYVGDIWKQQIAAQGIKLSPKGQLKKTVVTSGVPMQTHLSKPLSEIIIELNKESDNFFAEMIFKTLGATQKGEGSFEAGSAAVADVMKRVGIEGSYKQVDGSGLSRFDLITTGQMVKLLAFVQEQEYRDAFEKSLPIAGVDGTLVNRLKGTSAEKNLIAKTGSMGGVNTLSGYTTAKNGHKLAVSVLINGIYKSKYARDLQDFVALLASDYPNNKMPEVYVPQAPRSYELSSLLDPVLEKADAAGATAGVLVKSLNGSGDSSVLYERDADSLLTPASNMKLLTTATALAQLGPDYVYKTELYGSSDLPANGVLNGDLYVKGYGDPSLHTEDDMQVQDGTSMEKIVSWLKQKGIKRINGNLILDESYFDQQRLGLGWAWDDESYYYNPTLGALALNRGTVMVQYNPAKQEGAPVQITLVPNTSYVKVINEAKTVAANQENTFVILRDRGTNTIRISGNLPVNEAADYQRVPVEEPAKYTGTVLKEALVKAGITFAGNSTITVGAVPASAKKWTDFSSLPLRDLITYLNKKSDNFYAEMLLKTLGAVKKGEGSADAGAQVVYDTIKSMGGTTNFDMVDGSGLTRYDLISARHIVSVLEGMTKLPAFAAFDASLPIAGMDGTLKNRLKGTAAENNLHGKTGSMTGVNSLSGYITTKGGEKLVFSILLNGYEEDEESELFTGIQDQIATILASLE